MITGVLVMLAGLVFVAWRVSRRRARGRRLLIPTLTVRQLDSETRFPRRDRRDRLGGRP
jgi:hypothetical protein